MVSPDSKRSRGRIVWTAIIAAVAIAGAALLLGTRGPDDRVPASESLALGDDPIRLNLPYWELEEGRLHLDMVRPHTGTGPYPAVVAIHGGGWHAGNRASLRPLIRFLAVQGFVAVTIQYRHAPRFEFPDQLHDVKCAVRWLRANAAELDIDPDRIGIMGASAGAHLALMAGVTGPEDGLEPDCHPGVSSRVQAVVNVAGPTDLTLPTPPNVERLLEQFLGTHPGDSPEIALAASPVTFLSPDDPPILTLHGTADAVVAYEHALILQEAANSAGVRSTLKPIEGESHVYANDVLRLAGGESAVFFRQHLQ